MIVSDQRKRVIIKEAALQTASASMQIAMRLNTISYVSGEIDWRVEPVIKHYSIFEADPKPGYL